MESLYKYIMYFLLWKIKVLTLNFVLYVGNGILLFNGIILNRYKIFLFNLFLLCTVTGFWENPFVFE